MAARNRCVCEDYDRAFGAFRRVDEALFPGSRQRPDLQAYVGRPRCVVPAAAHRTGKSAGLVGRDSCIDRRSN